MTRVRVLGPRNELQAVLERVQDLGLVHTVQAKPAERLETVSFTPRQQRYVRSLERIRDDVDVSLKLLRGSRTYPARTSVSVDLPTAARVSRRTRRALETLEGRRRALEEERALILKFQPFFQVFGRILASRGRLKGVRVFYLVVRAGRENEIDRLRESLGQLLGDAFELISQPASEDETALLLVVSQDNVKSVESLLSEAGVDPLPLPESYRDEDVLDAITRMRGRLGTIPAELAELEAQRRQIAKDHGRELSWVQATVHDHLARIRTMKQAAVTPRAFVMEGWIPAVGVPALKDRLLKSFGDRVAVEVVSAEEWEGEPAPVVLSNPRLFRPFEAITKMMPLPHYGTIDPTPYVAIFFPMFFGIALGDIGYGMLLGLVALLLRVRSAPQSTLRSVSEIAAACALFTVVFGALYGELFGDLGHRWGLEPIIFSREEAIIPFLSLALALGFVHIVLGLCLGAAKALRGDPKQAAGRGIAALMVVLIAVALLAALGLLPERFFSPVVIALLIAFPILIVLEGIIAPIEFISTIGNVLSYARIMAVGTASVMMAVVANRMAGAFGSVVVGLVFALLFHLVNFVIGVFSPTIHMLRLHYVEFFGKFFSPGGTEYRPLRHWSPREGAT